MPQELVSIRPPCAEGPTLFAAAGHKALSRLTEFLTANIRNRNTRAAYGKAIGRFSRWCAEHGLRLEELTPVAVAAYIEELGNDLAKPSVKQHLAAIRMMFDYPVTGHIVPHNPAASVRGPKYVIKKGKTLVLTQAEARALIDIIDTRTIARLRDRALIGVMVYSFARIVALLPTHERLLIR